MTVMRQEWRQKFEGFIKIMRLMSLSALAVFIILAPFLGGGANAAVSRYVWSDPVTGFAIGGFDPLSFFTTRRPRKGIAKYEYEWRGVTFRFANKGNLAAFKAHPEIYAPRFGGYDAYAMADGKVVEGNPNIWMKQKQRVYLFASRKNRALWLVRRDDMVSEATRHWQEISKDFLP